MPLYNPSRKSVEFAVEAMAGDVELVTLTKVKRPQPIATHYDMFNGDPDEWNYDIAKADAYIDSIERQAMFTIAELNKRDAMRVERIRELESALEEKAKAFLAVDNRRLTAIKNGRQFMERWGKAMERIGELEKMLWKVIARKRPCTIPAGQESIHLELCLKCQIAAALAQPIQEGE